MSNHSLRIFAFVQSIRFSSIPLLASLYEARTLVTITVVFSRGVTGVICSFGVSETSVDELIGPRRDIKHKQKARAVDFSLQAAVRSPTPAEVRSLEGPS